MVGILRLCMYQWLTNKLVPLSCIWEHAWSSEEEGEMGLDWCLESIGICPLHGDEWLLHHGLARGNCQGWAAHGGRDWGRTWIGDGGAWDVATRAKWSRFVLGVIKKSAWKVETESKWDYIDMMVLGRWACMAWPPSRCAPMPRQSCTGVILIIAQIVLHKGQDDEHLNMNSKYKHSPMQRSSSASDSQAPGL